MNNSPLMPKISDSATVENLKQLLQDNKSVLAQALDENSLSIQEVIQARTNLIDRTLSHLWQQIITTTAPLCLLACGGYGRSILHPYSDIDVVILRTTADAASEQLQRFVSSSWDLGLKLSQMVATPSQLQELAAQEITTLTLLLDHRFICGNYSLYQETMATFDPKTICPPPAFFAGKMAEQEKRHQKFGQTSYNLEPNIKNGPGGLRDIQTIQWLAKYHFGVTDLAQLVTLNFLTENELATLLNGRSYLWQLRSALHHLSDRQEERLFFDHQTKLAQQRFGTQLPLKEAVEKMMQEYYRTVKDINELNDMLLQLFQEAMVFDQQPYFPQLLDENFRIINQAIEVTHPNVFPQQPKTLLQIFVWMGKHPEVSHVRANTIRLLRQYRYLIDAAFRQDPQHRQLFITLFKLPGDCARILRLMNRYDILGAYIPCFQNIIGKMQYDLFHVYTIDRHLIFALANLYRFQTSPQYQQRFPLCADLMQQLSEQTILRLAVLFHDVGKESGQDHSKYGAQLAETFAEQHGLTAAEKKLLSWLIVNHLLMSSTAQCLVVYDPEVINQFAAKIPNLNYLNHLYLLTCADIYATNESLWNNWRSTLLKDLYQLTYRFLNTQQQVVIDAVHARKEEAKKLLLPQLPSSMGEDIVETLWNDWNKPYFLHHSPERIASHSLAILTKVDPEAPLVLINPYFNQGGTEVFIYLPDQNYIFANTVAILDRLNLNVLEAQIITAKNGYTLDSYIILDHQHNLLTDEKQSQQLCQRLTHSLSHLSSNPKTSQRRTSRRLKHFSYACDIQFSTSPKGDKTILEIVTINRPGLLTRISQGLVKHQLKLHHAKISTLGDHIEDTFYLTDQQNHPVQDLKHQHDIAATLKKLLSY